VSHARRVPARASPFQQLAPAVVDLPITASIPRASRTPAQRLIGCVSIELETLGLSRPPRNLRPGQCVEIP